MAQNKDTRVPNWLKVAVKKKAELVEVEIMFRDLVPEKQQEILAIYDVETASEANLDVFPLTTFDVDTEIDSEASKKEAAKESTKVTKPGDTQTKEVKFDISITLDVRHQKQKDGTNSFEVLYKNDEIAKTLDEQIQKAVTDKFGVKVNHCGSHTAAFPVSFKDKYNT